MRCLAGFTLVCLTLAAVVPVYAQSPQSPLQYTQAIYSPLAGEQLQAAPMPEPVRQPVTLSLQAALERTLSGNPDLVAVRQTLRVSAEAVQVAKLLPTNLNPTASVDVRPWVFGPTPGGGTERLLPFVSVSWNQPVELGARTAKRTMIAHAEYQQTHWTIVQTELLALVQTYRAYQTAVYRRDKLLVARELAGLNGRLLDVLQRQLEANQVPAADVVLANVENLSAEQRVDAAQQDYIDALAVLRQQIGTVELADSAEPDGKLETPQDTNGDDEDMVQTALCVRPEVQAARAQAERSRAALSLARADRIPIPSVGPVYEKNEAGASFYGMTVSTPIPVWNAGGRLAIQREAEYHRDMVAYEQSQQRVIVQVKTSAARWSHARQLATRTTVLMQPLAEHEARMERLFTAGQTDLVKLLQVRQRWLDGANTQLDTTWQATQAYADLLASLGGVTLLGLLPVQPNG